MPAPKWERMLLFSTVVKSIANHNLSATLMLHKCHLAVYVSDK